MKSLLDPKITILFEIFLKNLINIEIHQTEEFFVIATFLQKVHLADFRSFNQKGINDEPM